MKTTSHFIGIELKNEYFLDIFVNIYKYLKENNIENILHFQNPLSMHTTLYYLEKNISENEKNNIKEFLKKFDVKKEIFLDNFNYFHRGEQNKYVLYFSIKTELDLENYRNILHENFNRDFVEDNNFSFCSHITFFRIQNPEIFKKHKKNIENIIKLEFKKLKNVNLNSEKIFLYAVNSEFKEEVQIKLK